MLNFSKLMFYIFIFINEFLIGFSLKCKVCSYCLKNYGRIKTCSKGEYCYVRTHENYFIKDCRKFPMLHTRNFCIRGNNRYMECYCNSNYCNEYIYKKFLLPSSKF